jgi:hypothetical protein
MTADGRLHLDLPRVEAVTRDVIMGYAWPFELLSVEADVAGWRMLVRGMSHRVIDISIAYATTAAQLRAELKQQLDTAYF